MADVYRPFGILAVRPEAIGMPVTAAAPPANSAVGPVAVVRVSGPLAFGFQEGCDTYDAILARFDAALSSGAKAILLDIDSPGGEVAGMLECARGMRSKATAAGKRFVAYTTSQACSAGYALAVAADEVYCSDTAEVGSIGVIGMLVDASALDAAMGLKFTTITSGARKADGNPHEPVSEGALGAAQGRVDALARVFFEWVAERRGLAADAVAGLQAGVFVGAGAVAVGLANGVSSRAKLIESLAVASEKNTLSETESQTTPENQMDEENEKKEDATRASLVTASESDDPEKAARAKRALAAYDEEDKCKDDSEDKEATSASTATASAVSLDANEVAERAKILASRPDLGAAFIAQVASLPSAQLRALVNSLPKVAPAAPAAPATKKAAAKTSAVAELARSPESGDELDTSKPTRLSEHADELDQLMGLVETKRTTETKPGALVLGVRKGLSK